MMLIGQRRYTKSLMVNVYGLDAALFGGLDLIIFLIGDISDYV